MNIHLSQEILSFLYQCGIENYVLCAGARNAPLIKAITAQKELKFTHFFDERAAAFFALGLAKQTLKPVGVVTTSGTAAAELLPAVVEAYYSGVSLVMLTADRPRSYRGTGAPQSIEQVGLFSHYAKTFDIEEASGIETIHLEMAKPTHLNICFNEPLIDAEVEPRVLSISSQNNSQKVLPSVPVNQNDAREVEDFFAVGKKPLVVLGAIPAHRRSSVYEYLSKCEWPIYAEAQSGLRESKGLQKWILRGGEKSAYQLNFDSVLRFGSVPTFRIWRDLEHKLKNVPVLSVTDSPFSGLARGAHACLGFESFFTNANLPVAESQISSLGLDREYELKWSHLLNQHPASEPAYFRWLSEQIPNDSQIFLGNSLPIREWDLAATFENKNFTMLANRGANGIDGLIATFLGSARAENENWLILGDLSALYDLNALALTSSAISQNLRMVIVNNYGGQIFKPMFRDPHFLNSHKYHFEKMTEMFNWSYIRIDKQTPLALEDTPTVLEILPSEQDTEILWEKVKRIFN